MADANSPLLDLLLMGDGLHNTDWGDQTNANLTKLENAIAATKAIAVTGTAQTVSAADSSNAVLNFIGTLTGNTTITLPAVSKTWLVKNSTTMGSDTLTLTTGSGSTVSLPAGALHVLYCDGTNVIDVTSANATALGSDTILANLGSGTVAATYSQILDALGLNTGNGPTFAGLNLSSAAGTGRQINFATSGVTRWDFGADNAAESGSNSGSNFFMDAVSDTGTVIGRVLAIARATLAATFGGTVNAPKIQQGGNALLPAGAIMPFAFSGVPGGWLACDGSAVSRTTYADLFTALGTFYGAGDGSTTFNLPDYRGYFLRGCDNGRGVDPGRAFGSAQADANQAFNLQNPNIAGQGSEFGQFSGINNGGAPLYFQTQTVDGPESRPKNYAVNYCIKT